MAEMLTDLMQNIYSRISQLGKSIKNLQNSVEQLNTTLIEKVQTLVDSIQDMTESVKKEGEMQSYYFEEIGDNAVNEIKLLQEKIGLKDLDEVLHKLSEITAASEEALKPETVDLLLHEVLEGIKEIKTPSVEKEMALSDEDLLEKVNQSLSEQEKISSQVQQSENQKNTTQPPKPPTFVPPKPADSEKAQDSKSSKKRPTHFTPPK